jgi:flagellum-specific peptidoglycan hydrolase FlgJ/LysM repeat protein
MKQKALAPRAFAQPAIFFMTTILMFAACHTSKSGINANQKGKVPTGYGTTGALTTQQARLNYVDRFKGIAVREMERTGIPASIKLAQGLLESDAGRSNLANQANNHFGVKCHSDWQGARFYKEDDDYDPVTKELLKSCFRVYKNADESFVEHSEFLRDPRKVARYGPLFQLAKTDYVGWANGLEKAGYATSDTYSEALVKMIEDYQLAQFDGYTSAEIPMAGTKPVANNTNNRPPDNFPVNGNQPAYTPPSSGGNKPNNAQTDPNQLPYFDPSNPNGAQTSANPQSGDTYSTANGGYVAPPPADMTGSRNDVKYIRAMSGQTLYEVAGKNGVRVDNLQAYNEEIGDPNRPLENGLVLYTQKKRNAWHGAEKKYTVKDCETMYDIAQKFGIKLSKLYSKNEMRDGEQPQVGEKILLRRGWFQGADKPALRDTFSEWRRCKTPANNGKPQMSTPVSRPGSSPNSVFENEMSPTNGAVTQPSTSGGMSYPPPVTQPNYQNNQNTSYPTTSYPTTSTGYPDATTYPTTTTEYPSTTTYPTTSETTTSYPSYPSTTSSPSYPTYPSRPATSYPTTSTAPKPTAPKPTTTAKPTAKPTPAPTTPAAKPAPQAMGQFYTVQPKETLWAISQRFKTTVDALKKLNNMTDNNLQIGQQIRIR